MTAILRGMRSGIAVALCAGVSGACHDPVTPTPRPPIPERAPFFTRSVRVSGSVTDQSGAPINGALVEATTNVSWGSSTDAAGKFDFAVNASGLLGSAAFVNVRATRFGYLPDFQRVEVREDGPDSFTVSLALTSEMPTLVEADLLSATITSRDSECYSEFLDGDYLRSCRFFSLKSPADADLRVELRWAGTPKLQLWIVEGLTATQASAGTDPSTLIATAPRGRMWQVLVGIPPGTAVTDPVAFSLLATRMVSSGMPTAK